MPTTNPQGWIQNVTSFAPFVAALAALFVGWLQWRIQSRHLKHNLYEKRYAVFDAARTYLIDTLSKNGREDMNAHIQFRVAVAPAEFLFPESVYEHLKRIGEVGLEYCDALETIRECSRLLSPPLLLPEPQRQETVQKHTEAMRDMKRRKKEIVKELDSSLKAEFSPWLKIEYERPWFDSVEATLDRWNKRGEEALASRYKS